MRGSAMLRLAARVPPAARRPPPWTPAALDARHEDHVAQGAAIAGPPAWRRRALFFHDPGGNLVESCAET